MSRVSVIIPSYNCAAFLPHALGSVFAQTTSDWDVIVVDDGSSDDTREVLEPYVRHPRVRYVRQENSGLPAARNSGARESQAEYLAFLDADDGLAPNALELMTAALDSSGASWCLTDIVKVLGAERDVRRTVLPDGDLFMGILREDFVRRGMFFRRRSFVGIGMYDERMRYREDWDINIRMFERREPFVYLGQPLYRYSWREGSITTGNQARILFYTQKILRKHHKTLADAGDRRVAKIYAYNMWDLARRYIYAERDYGNGLGCARESIAYDANVARLLHPMLHHFRRLTGTA